MASPKVLIILSAQYVSDEIAVEFGPLPPSFLPLGPHRLFELQADFAGGERCVLTLPDDFQISSFDEATLAAAEIDVVWLPPRLSLTESLGRIIAELRPQPPLRILYGDTLVGLSGAETDHADWAAVNDNAANYPWAYAIADADGTVSFSDDPPPSSAPRRIVCGYYRISDPDLLRAACAQPTITAALNEYAEGRPFDLLEVETWYDFGHLPLYYQSKARMLVSRAFNRTTSDGQTLVKTSSQRTKMDSEAQWYEGLPAEVRGYTPTYLGRVEEDGRAGYALEYLFHPTISDLYVFGRLPVVTWHQILTRCFDFLVTCRSIRPPPATPEAAPDFADVFYEDMFRSKTRSRLDTYCTARGVAVDTTYRLNGIRFPPLNEIARDIFEVIPPTRPENICFWHGDLFFGNMFFDFRAQRMVCVDPRGQLDDGRPCRYGDYRYDLAKLAHSVLGHYDKTILSRSRLTRHGPTDWTFEIEDTPGAAEIADIFIALAQERFGIGAVELHALAAMLFISMLPLHYDDADRQDRMLASGLRLYGRLKGLAR
jgi:hypothetical protein